MNGSTENPIETMAARLQTLPPEIRWLYLQADLVEALSIGCPPVRGPRTRLADRSFAIFGRLGLGRVAISAANVLLLVVVYTKQYLTRNQGVGEAAIFVGINALREPELVRRFGELQGRPVLHMDERKLGNFFRHGRVPFFKLLHEMRMVWREVWANFHLAYCYKVSDKAYLLSFFMTHGHRFAYLRAWFRHYLRQPGAFPVIACTAAGYVSYAVVAAGAETHHMMHGFQRQSLIYPDFAQSLCFTGFEAAHLRRRLPRCKVMVVSKPARPIDTRRVAAVAGIYWEPDGFDRIRPFIEWARRNQLPVIVRKHPADTSDYWTKWQGVAGVEVAEDKGSFVEFLEKFRPRILASWNSTTLFDALINGVVPVTVVPDRAEALDIVFPFHDLSLRWPEHEVLARMLIDNDRRRAEFLARNGSLALDMPAEVVPRHILFANQSGLS